MVEDKEYEGTPGLWELIVSKKPTDYTNDDYGNYANLMLKTNALDRDNNPDNNYPKSSRRKNGIEYLKQFGIIGKNTKEVELLLFQVILTRS